MKRILLISFMLLSFIFLEVWAQQRTVSGKVVGPKGEGIPGVTVRIKGTSQGVSTDFEGNYKLQIPSADATLVFSSIGFETKEIPVGNRSVIDVTLTEDIKQLQEVVVTALGIEREKKALGYAVSEVEGDQVIKSGEYNVVQGLSSKVAGVNIVSSAGVPGASSKIQIRGASSFTRENQPLFVIDGVPIDNSTTETTGRDNPFNSLLEGVNYSNRAVDINPNDIETISVLKGPAAAALYGVRAAAGAIVITTKKGRKNQKPTVTISSNVSFDRINKMYDIQGIYAQGVGGGNQFGLTPEYLTFDFVAPLAEADLGTSDVWGPRISELGLGGPYDNIDNFFETGVSVTNDVSVSLGTEKSSFRFSAGMLESSGIVPETEFDRYSFRLNAGTQLTDQVDVFSSFTYIQSGGVRAQTGSNISGVMLGLTRAPRSFDIAAGYELPDGRQRTYFYIYDNPFWTVNKNPFTDKTSRTLGNFSANYKPLEWLKFTYRVGTDFYTDRREGILAIGSRASPGDFEGELTEDVNYNKEIYQDILATFSPEINERFTASLTLGNNINDRRFSSTYGRSRFLSIPEYYNLNNGSDLYTDEFDTHIRTAALFFDANGSFNETIYLSVSGRYEWSSTFGPEDNTFFYPSVSASFVFSELGALQNSNILSFGKLRLAYAESGNSPDVYDWNTVYTSPIITDGFTNGLSFPYLEQAGFSEGGILGNRALRPERLKGYEVGFDLRFFDGRLTADLTGYYQKSVDILLQRPLARSTGFDAVVDNSGEMENYGIEALVGGDIVRSGDFIWNASINFALNRNEVLKLAEGVTELSVESAFTSIGSYAIVGEPYGAFFGTAWERSPDGKLLINPSSGLPLVADQIKGLGNPFPKWQAGFRNTITYKGISLTGLIDIREGNDLWNGTAARLARLGQLEATVDRDRNYIIPGVVAVTNSEGGTEYVENNIPISAFDYFRRFVGDGGGASEQFIQDGSWVRLRELRLSYQLQNVEAIPFLGNLELSVTGRNLWLNTDYVGVDPETSLTGAGSNINGFDYFNMPSTYSFSFGLNATFR